MTTMVSDADLRAEFSRRGRPHTAKFFERYCERVEALYASLR
jgi:hypothetical protein